MFQKKQPNRNKWHFEAQIALLPLSYADFKIVSRTILLQKAAFSRLVPVAAVALEIRSDFAWLASAGWIRTGFGRGWNRGTFVRHQISR